MCFYIQKAVIYTGFCIYGLLIKHTNLWPHSDNLWSLSAPGMFAYRLWLRAGLVCAARVRAAVHCIQVENQMSGYHTWMNIKWRQSLCVLPNRAKKTHPFSIVLVTAAARLSCNEFLATTAGNTPSLGWKSGLLHSQCTWVGMNGRECVEVGRGGNVTVHDYSDLSCRGHKLETRWLNVTLKHF